MPNLQNQNFIGPHFHLLLKILLIACCFAQSQPLKASQPKLGDLFYKIPKKMRQSIRFVRVSDGHIIFEHKPNNMVTPASVTKIITAAAALHYFGHDFQFETKIYHTGKRKNGTILGDLYIRGSGDPMLTNEKLWQLAADIRHLGIREIKGNLIIDNSLFDTEYRDSSRIQGRKISSHAYDSPITPLGVSFNTFAIAIAPGQTIGSKAYVSIDPYPFDSLEIGNKLITRNGNSKPSIRVSRVSLKNKQSSLFLSGKIPVNHSIKKVYRSVSNPLWASSQQIRSFFKNEGISISGTNQEGNTPADAVELYTLSGYPMHRIVNGLNKYSNNFIADMLTKALGSWFPKGKIIPLPPTWKPTPENQNDKNFRKSKPAPKSLGTMAGGVETINHFLKEVVKTKQPWVIKNGSGLSPDNQFSASFITDILLWAANDMNVFPEFISSLPSSGKDGTLRKRFSKRETHKFRGLIRAKTGTLSQPFSVSSIAGYLRHETHGLVAFAILENGLSGRAQPSILDIRERQDFALAWFHKK
ncbi:MAG: D-alanyl-D-alanine carboxypeptidase/D-alanyl-D-alanine-endopeptidase [Zetaproteobacteria bacterium]|nr:D-alanyl-D-alanine carboxypeptidase/D-alanyl-D-alanine-endopeptidase [Pseudobdellovibrionaceae bacterium]